MKSKVSYITVNYNAITDTLELLESIYNNSYKNFEVIVVDNNSKESPKYKIEENFPEVKIVLSEKNLGFAGGNNLGIDQSTGDYLFFINNDTVITDGCIETLIETIDKYPNVGGVSPMIMYFDQKEYIQFAGFTKINPITGRNNTIGEMQKDNKQYAFPYEIPYMHGAAMFVPTSIIRKAGKLPEFFFLYYEELDWSQSILENGFRLLFQPKAKVFHKESVTVGKDSTIKVFFLNRNRIWFMRRNYSRGQFILFLIFFTLISMPKNFLRYLIRGELANLVVLIKAYKSGVSQDSKVLMR